MTLDYTEFNNEHKKETYRSMVVISTEAIKALILVNGGAAAGIVAALEKLTKTVPIHVIQGSMVCFVMGLTLALVSFFLGYFTQANLHEENMGRGIADAYKKWWFMTIVAAICSLALFCAGGLMMAFNAGAA